MDLRHRAVAVLGAIALLGVTPSAVSADTPSSRNVLTVLGEGGWVLGHGTTSYAAPARYDAKVWEMGIGGSDRDDVRFLADMPEGTRALGLVSAPTSRPRFTVGHYASGRMVTADEAQFDMGYDSRGCNTTPGWIDVLGLSRDAQGRLTSLALDYSFQCESADPPVRGSLRWNSDFPYRHTAVTAFVAPETSAGNVARGTVTLTNTGDLPQTYGPATWQTRVPGDTSQASPVIERDFCTGVTLAPGALCTVEVSAQSDGTRNIDGYLRTPDDTLRGAAYAPVSMRAVPAPGSVTLTARPARGGVLLSTAERYASYRVLRATGTGPEVEVARGVTMPWTDTAVSGSVRYRYRAVATIDAGEGPPSAQVTAGPLPVPLGNEGLFVPVGPVRVLDTRSGLGAPMAPLAAGGVMSFDPAAAGDVPSTGVSAVVLNVTATQPTAATYLQVRPAGHPPGGMTSSVNVTPGQTRPNQVIVPIGRDGRVEVYNDLGSTDVVVDVQGYYSAVNGPHGSGYHPSTPTRFMDTRMPGSTVLGPGEARTLYVGIIGAEAGQISAVDVNLTVTAPTAAGHLTAWSGQDPAPHASNVNFAPGQTVANHAVVPVTYNERGRPVITLRNSAGSSHVVVDVLGWYDQGTSNDGLRFRPVSTTRLMDTRATQQRLQRDEARTIPGALLPNALGHVVNATATASTGAGHLTAWDGNGAPPGTSTLNFNIGEDSANLATPAVGPDGALAFVSGGSAVHLVVDQLGYFY